MANNLDKYKKDLDALVDRGKLLLAYMMLECYPDKLRELGNEQLVAKQHQHPKFKDEYQAWYSEALAVVKNILPDRLNDFIKCYEKQKNRKEISYENYTIEDYLQGLNITRAGQRVVWIDAGYPKYEQQLNILKSCKQRFKSSLFDIKQLLQADIFDSELEAAKELNKKGFMRGAGAMVGVVLEAHFVQVCEARNIKQTKKHPTINDYNELLKVSGIITVDVFRHIQLLGDLRNKCDHKKDAEPTKREIDDLISGAEKIIKTVF